MVELADTPDLGSGGQPCRFKSCYPHQKRSTGKASASFLGSAALWAAPPGLFHLLGASESPRHQDFCLRQKCLERRTRGGFFTDFGFDSPCQKERHSFGNVFLFGFLRLWTAPPYLFYLLGRNKSARHQDFCYAKMLDTPHSRRIFSPTSGLTLLAKLEATFWPCDAGLKCSLYF